MKNNLDPVTTRKIERLSKNWAFTPLVSPSFTYTSRSRLPHVINLQHPRFVISAVDFPFESDEESAGLNIAESWDNDIRLIKLTFPNDPNRVSAYVSREAILKSLLRLNIILAQSKRDKLSIVEFNNYLRLHISDDIDITSHPCLKQLGVQNGLIACTLYENIVAFPLAHILSKFPDWLLMDVTAISSELITKSTQVSLFSGKYEATVNDLLEMIPLRVRYVVEHREGLCDQEPQTLEEIGVVLGYTRERVRQIEAKFWKKLAHNQEMKQHLLRAFLFNYYRRSGKLIYAFENLKEERSLVFVLKCLDIPFSKIPPGDHELLIGVSESVFSSLLRSKPFQPQDIEIFAVSEEINSHREFVIQFDEAQTLVDRIVSIRKNKLNKRARVYLALKSLGKPSHFTKVAAKYNQMFPDDYSSERAIHASLGFETHGVVWIGLRGTFALSEWGYEHPPQGLFKSVIDIVTKRHLEFGCPVSFNYIVSEIGKYRMVVNSTSLMFAAYCNPGLHRVGKDGFEPCSSLSNEDEDSLNEILSRFEAPIITPSPL